jgi:DNA-binding MarR family transcriptional regulator
MQDGAREVRADGDRVDASIAEWKRLSPDAPLGEPTEIVARIKVLSRLFIALSERHAAETAHLHPGFVETLYVLYLAGPPFEMGPSGLAQRLGVTTAAMTNRLDRLSERGLIERRADPSDRRALVIRLTEEGGRVALRAVEENERLAGEFVAGLSGEEQAALNGLLRRLLKHAEQAAGAR